MSSIILFILTAYALLIAALIVGYLRLPIFRRGQSIPRTRFSVCVAFRNEAKNLPALLDSLSRLDYPSDRFEVLLVDDASTDTSVDIIERFLEITTNNVQLQLLKNERNTSSPKKDALNVALKKAQNPWIVTTDADCFPPENWLKTFDDFIQKNECSRFIAAPVCYLGQAPYFLGHFQQLDFLSLQGATIGGFGLRLPFMCNGANLAFAKADFLRLKGYEGNDAMASGDDVFLMHKFIKEKKAQVTYLNSLEATVRTLPQISWKSLANQRKRWAAKASAYKNPFSILVSLVVILGNLAMILALFFVWDDPRLAFCILLKFGVDLILILLSASFFSQKKLVTAYLWVFLIYPFFTIFVALSSLSGRFEWKGRKFKK